VAHFATNEFEARALNTVQTIGDLRARVRSARAAGKTIGCVPTMGALHDGHMSLAEAARKETDFVVVTIFVNPMQFAPKEDLSKYPRPLEDDLRRCEDAGVDLVFNPAADTVYPADNAAFIDVPACSMALEGANRPSHFRGVTTVVLKLFNMVLPDIAFFGQKDYQQQLLIRHMVNDLNVPVEIRTCPTVREANGLAMSSRNAYLSAADRQSGLALSQALKIAHDTCTTGGKSVADARQDMLDHLSQFPEVKLDYAVIADANTLSEVDDAVPKMVALIAAKVGSTRLLDNILISQSAQS
jgi:pantoate--beta-alanine ligase